MFCPLIWVPKLCVWSNFSTFKQWYLYFYKDGYINNCFYFMETSKCIIYCKSLCGVCNYILTQENLGHTMLLDTILKNSLDYCFKDHTKLQITLLIWCRTHVFFRTAALGLWLQFFLVHRLKTTSQKLQVMTIINKSRKWCIKGRHWSKFFSA